MRYFVEVGESPVSLGGNDNRVRAYVDALGDVELWCKPPALCQERIVIDGMPFRCHLPLHFATDHQGISPGGRPVSWRV